MRKVTGTISAIFWTALFALVLTFVVSGTWAALLLTNLKRSPGIPWAAVVMALVLWAIWSFLQGQWGPAKSREARRSYLRAEPLAWPVAIWAVIAGVLWIIFLAGFWIVMHQLVAAQSNPLPDFSKLSPVMVIVSLLMASISGAVSEEAGFRGFFQGALERRDLGIAAILICSLVMAPIHALSQGFVWPTILFYLLVDGMLGAMVFITGSIRPGIVVHAIGLFTFFYAVWPHDKERHLIGGAGADGWFWIHAAQAVVFGILSVVVFRHVARQMKA
jgi:membrane protease YdiL (CAAX protease family)